MSAKGKKGAPLWFKCEKCHANIAQKDVELHDNNCPPVSGKFTHSYVLRGNLNGPLSVKANEEIKGVSSHERNNFVFLSQSAIQLCSFVIGDWAVVKTLNSCVPSCARIVWPTVEKSLCSVLVTQSAYDLYWKGRPEPKVTVSKLHTSDLKEAKQIVLISQNSPKLLQLTSEISIRLKKLNLNRFVAEGNKLTCFFYGKLLEFIIREIVPSEQKNEGFSSGLPPQNLQEKFNALNSSTPKKESESQSVFCKTEGSIANEESHNEERNSFESSPQSLDVSVPENKLADLEILTPKKQSKSETAVGKILDSITIDSSKTPLKNLQEKIADLSISVPKVQPVSEESDGVFYKIVESTAIKLFGDEKDLKKRPQSINPLLEIGGLESEITEVQDLADVALGKVRGIPGLKPTRGVLLYGPPGTGKSLLASAVAEVSQAHIVKINGPDLYSKYLGGHQGESPEQVISALFKEALDYAPSVILLDELDVLCPGRASRVTEQERRVVAALLTQIDQLNQQVEEPKVFLLATTSKPESIDSSFRRCGRLDREIEIGIPGPLARLKILKKLLPSSGHDLEESDLREIANAAHGFVGADLASLCSRAAMRALKHQSSPRKLCKEDLKFALTRVKPSAMREIFVEVPDVKWSQIGGQHGLKLALKQAVEWPLTHPESFIRLGITPPRGVLMFGPPGCSKTMIAKALATESGLNFLSIKGPELFSKWVGESERALREVFRRARQVAPSIIFFDELDALGGERTASQSTGGTSVQERILAQLLTELDGITPLGDVTILAATNRPDKIDKALLRPGRLDRIIYVPLPDTETRREIFNLKLAKMPVSNVSVNNLVELTEGYSGAEIQAVCHEAAMKALEENIDALNVQWPHFEQALTIITPRTPPSLIKIYDDYLNK